MKKNTENERLELFMILSGDPEINLNLEVKDSIDIVEGNFRQVNFQYTQKKLTKKSYETYRTKLSNNISKFQKKLKKQPKGLITLTNSNVLFCEF